MVAGIIIGFLAGLVGAGILVAYLMIQHSRRQPSVLKEYEQAGRGMAQSFHQEMETLVQEQENHPKVCPVAATLKNTLPDFCDRCRALIVHNIRENQE